MDNTTFNQAADHLGITINLVTPLRGGDIARSYLLETSSGQYFCKLANGHSAYDMFYKEQMGLESIAKTKTIRVPRIYYCGELGDGAGLVMEYISTKSPTSADYERLGQQLAQLHKTSCPVFGWKTDNYIGSLLQSNKDSAHWPSFYLEERLVPQLTLSSRLGMLSEKEIPGVRTMSEVVRQLLPETNPVIVHGDLWAGNFLISRDGSPCLIDPAAYAGHHEVDMAMTRLFGGFDSRFYEAYEEIVPNENGMEERLELYQLYYLLVHLNLFGKSYYKRVRGLLSRYFN